MDASVSLRSAYTENQCGAKPVAVVTSRAGFHFVQLENERGDFLCCPYVNVYDDLHAADLDLAQRLAVDYDIDPSTCLRKCLIYPCEHISAFVFALEHQHQRCLGWVRARCCCVSFFAVCLNVLTASFMFVALVCH